MRQHRNETTKQKIRQLPDEMIESPAWVQHVNVTLVQDWSISCKGKAESLQVIIAIKAYIAGVVTDKHTQPQRGSWSVKSSSVAFGWNENLQTLSPPWHITAHPCLSVYINLSARPIQKWRSLFPLLSAFAFLLMQGEMDCWERWLNLSSHPPSSSTGNTLHRIQLHYCILLCIK